MSMTAQNVPGSPVEVAAAGSAAPPRAASSPGPASARRAQPKWSGSLAALLEAGPAFSPALRGYNQVEVDNYVASAETELSASRRLTTEMLDRVSSSEAALRRARELLAQSPHGRDLAEVSERVAGILRLAAEEAEATTRSGQADAERIVADAWVEADLIKRRLHKLEAEAAARLEHAERRESDAAAAVERTREQAARSLHEAAAERQRLDTEAAQARAAGDTAAAEQRAALQEKSRLACQAEEAAAAARVMVAEQQLESLLCRQDAVHRYLCDLTGHVDTVLRALQVDPDPGFSFVGNQAAAIGAETAAPSPRERAELGASSA
jgi:colicin import membrane protein